MPLIKSSGRSSKSSARSSKPSEPSSAKTILERVRLCSEARSQPPPTLRQSLGRALVERATMDDGYVTDETKPMKQTYIGCGTPGRPQPGQRLRPRWKRTVVVYKEPRNPPRPLHLSPTEAQSLLIGCSSPLAPQEAEVLAHALTEYVERTGILSGYSSIVIALACTLAVEILLKCELLASRLPKGLQTCYQAVRCAYNSLWLQRDKLRKLMQIYQAVRALQPPADTYGNPHKILIKMDRKAKKQS